MTQKEKALLKDIAGMIEKLIDMSGKEENQQQAAVEEEDNHGGHEEDDLVDYDDVDFVKGMLKDDVRGLKFVAFCGDGHIAKGGISKQTFNAMCNAFLEKYA